MSKERAGRQGKRFFLIEPLDITEEEARKAFNEVIRKMSTRRRQEYAEALAKRMERDEPDAS